MAGTFRFDDRTGILLVGHGTRSELGTAQFLALAGHLAESFAPAAVEPAFLELQSPTIETAVGRLVSRPIERLTTVPLLLFTAGHAKQDIPRAVEQALVHHQAAHLPHWQTAAFGCHEALVRLSNLRLEEALCSAGNNAPTNIGDNSPPVCIVVGRGSRDESATAEMHAFVRQKAAAYETMHFEVAFAALATPLLTELLPRIAASGRAQMPAQVIVQPHLLFAGELVDRIERQTAEAANQWSTTQGPAIEWLIAPILAGRQAADSTHFPLLERVIRDSIVAAVSQ